LKIILEENGFFAGFVLKIKNQAIKGTKFDEYTYFLISPLDESDL